LLKAQKLLEAKVLFDWFTVFAQIANFLILMWLLKRFLYKPVLKAIDAREARIAKLLSETEQSQIQIQIQQSEVTAKNKAFSKEREVLLAQVNTDAEALKGKLNEAARNDATSQRTKWITELKEEQQKLASDINKHAQQAVFSVARKTLKDLSNLELDTQVAAVFIKKLARLDAQERQSFYADTHEPLTIRSAFPLSDNNKQTLVKAIETSLSPSLSIQFEVNSALVSGIEMLGCGHKLSWNIDDYLKNFKHNIDELVSSTTQRHTMPKVAGE
jgi:F-type H+-transporting ATPase subunit b